MRKPKSIVEFFEIFVPNIERNLNSIKFHRYASNVSDFLGPIIFVLFLISTTTMCASLLLGQYVSIISDIYLLKNIPYSIYNEF